jgi:hypothetical protein
LFHAVLCKEFGRHSWLVLNIHCAFH